MRKSVISRRRFSERGSKKYPIMLRCHRFNKNVSEEQVEKALKYAKATLAIEGQNISKGAETIIRKRLKNEITQKEFRQAALEIATRR